MAARVAVPAQNAPKMRHAPAGLTVCERRLDRAIELWVAQLDRAFNGAQAPLLDTLVQGSPLAANEEIWLARQGITGMLANLLNADPAVKQAYDRFGWRGFSVYLTDYIGPRGGLDPGYAFEARFFESYGYTLALCTHPQGWPRKTHWYLRHPSGRRPGACRAHSVAARKARQRQWQG